ncbi:MAG: YggT family protein [Syntrophotalea acetylenica]|nr:YggT family protein [Syntrophotalea acetylenica]MDD4457989.1 YggT family protein [Syntrophotalea acetylenica]MDY0261763.1 YggT family protein [Syntrophotalea acetylenica]
MGILQGLQFTLIKMVASAIEIYAYIVVARAILSWVNPDPYNPIVRFLYNATEPVLQRLRRLLPLRVGGLDFTPMVLIFVLFFVSNFLRTLLFR